MSVDLEKMLEKCERGQWRVDDFDWRRRPDPLPAEKEMQVCAYFANMSYIECLAGALFHVHAASSESLYGAPVRGAIALPQAS